jgi:hypothetical protein
MSQNVTLSTRISPAQAAAIAALATGSTVTEAAQQAGVARETVSRWVHRDPDFITRPIDIIRDSEAAFPAPGTNGDLPVRAEG